MAMGLRVQRPALVAEAAARTRLAAECAAVSGGRAGVVAAGAVAGVEVTTGPLGRWGHSAWCR